MGEPRQSQGSSASALGSEFRALDRRGFLAAGAGVLVAGGLLAACGSDSSGGGGGSRKRVVFAHPASTASIYPLLVYGARQEAEKRGYELLVSNADGQLDAQITELNTWIGQRVGGIIVLPLDNSAMGPLTKKARDNDVKFLNYSNKVIKGADGSVVFNNLQGAKIVGKYAGDWVKKNLGGKAQVALLTDNSQQAGRDRIYGAMDALKAVTPDVEVVAEQKGIFAADSLPVFQSMLRAQPDINVVFCIADDGCIGAEKAFMQTNPSKERQDQMFMAGWDGTIPVFKEIVADSVVRATGVLDLVKVGAACMDATINAVEGKGQTNINFPYLLAGQDNPKVSEGFIKRYESILDRAS